MSEPKPERASRTEKLQGEFTFLAQGTLYSDVIESAVMGSLGQTVCLFVCLVLLVLVVSRNNKTSTT